MTLDELMNDDLRQYIIQATSQEPPLLAHLRHETQTQTPFGRMLSGPVEGKLLQFLIKLSRAKTCLEVGTFTGYAALQIASALPIDGRLITCESRAHHAQIAQKYFDLSPHGHKIQLLIGDATRTLPRLDEQFDFIFIDADKINYPTYYDLLLPKLSAGGLMVVDNALWGGEVVNPQEKDSLAIHTLNQKARHDPQVECVMLSVRDGILLIRKL